MPKVTRSPIKIIIRRITTLQSIRNSHREVVGYKAECNHGRIKDSAKFPPTETQVFLVSKWGNLTFELAKEWTLNHKCEGQQY